jgi:adenosylcobinamide-phosphate synthase
VTVTRRRSGPGAHAGAVALGLAMDLLLGEPPLDPHPLALFGTVMDRVEASLPPDDRAAGVIHAALGTAIGAAAGAALGPAPATYLAVGGHALGRAAEDVARPLHTGDLDAARALLPSLVGRDPSSLDEPGIVRAVIESVAENTTDAVVAPALWALLAGGPGVLAHRAVNTMDAMVGHRTVRHRRYGWASARADDVANFWPARLTALLVVVLRPHRARAVWRAVREDAPAHPSPNSGVAEAAFAAALGIQLGGTTDYGERVEHRPLLGHGRSVEAGDIDAAVTLARDVHLSCCALAAGIALVDAARPRRTVWSSRRSVRSHRSTRVRHQG